MSYTLFQATLDLARICADVYEGASTSGSATTLVDTNMRIIGVSSAGANIYPPDDFFNGGTLWFRSGDAGASSGGRINTTEIITDFTSSSQRFTFATGTAVGAGVIWSAAPREYPRDALRLAINQALRSIGPEDQTDETLTTTADTGAYALPSGVYGVRQVEIATYTSAPYGYVPVPQTYTRGGYLYFEEGWYPTITGYKIRLTYNIVNVDISTDSSTISDEINRNWLQWKAAEMLYIPRIGDNGSRDKENKYALAAKEAKAMASRYRPLLRQIPRAHEHSAWATPVIFGNDLRSEDL